MTSNAMKKNPTGIMSWATHLGMLGAISMGNRNSVFINWILPHNKEHRIIKETDLETHLPKSKLSSETNSGFRVRANSLF
jgi:hypothetical protein